MLFATLKCSIFIARKQTYKQSVIQYFVELVAVESLISPYKLYQYDSQTGLHVYYCFRLYVYL